MAKRFTDTGKWAKSSFAELSLKHKLVWIYLCDNCDHAGIWDVNFGLMSYQIGAKLTAEDLKVFGDKVEWRGNKVFIHSFVDFQYGTLNPENRAHKSVIERLEKLAPSKPLTSPLQGAKDKDKEQDKEKETKGDARGGAKLPDLARLWNEHCGELPKVAGLNKARETRIRERLAEIPDLETWKAIIERIAVSDFCNARLPDSKGWLADFDWLIQPETQLKVREGKYDNRKPKKAEIKNTARKSKMLPVAVHFLALVKHYSAHQESEILDRLSSDHRPIWQHFGYAAISDWPRDEEGRQSLAKAIEIIITDSPDLKIRALEAEGSC